MNNINHQTGDLEQQVDTIHDDSNTGEQTRPLGNTGVSEGDSPSILGEPELSTLKRGPELPAAQPRFGSRFPHAAMAKVALDTGIALAVVGLNSKKNVISYRINLGTEAIAKALKFGVNALTSDDKQKKVEVVVHGEDIAETLAAGIERHDLAHRVEFFCPIEPIILNARFARVPPHTASLTVAWPNDWPRPVAGRAKAFLIPVRLVRFRQDTNSLFAPTPEPLLSASTEDVLSARGFVAAELDDCSLSESNPEDIADLH